MDSASGSLQSSSGGDEEYDSHHQHEFIPPFPNFFNNNINIIPPSQIISSGSIPQLPFHLPHNYNHNLQLQQQPTFFDFSSHNNYNLIQPNLNPPDSSSSFVNLDHMLRPTTNTTLRSEPTFNNLPSPSSPPHGSTSSQIQPSFRAGSSSVAAEAQAQPRPSIPNNNDNEPRSSASHPKNTKKRTRASRRAPTTVLTTDTSNFRAMVQEFTGIPAPPFSATGSSYSRRFDLFGSSIRSTTTHLEPNGSGSGLGSGLYPLRQKVQVFTSSTTPPSLNNNVMVDSAASSSKQIQQLAGVSNENQTVSNIQQQEQGFIVSLQNLSGQAGNSSHSHGQMVSASSEAMHNDGIKWRGMSTTGTGRPNNASSSNINNCKLNYSISGSSSKFHPDKDIMANISRGENTLDSWICPSD